MADNKTHNTHTNSEEFADQVADFAKKSSLAIRAPGALAGTVRGVTEVGVGAVPFVGKSLLGGKGIGEALGGSMQATAEKATHFNGLDQLLATATAGARVIQAGDLAINKGDHVAATGKLVRGAAEAATILYTLAGPLGVAAELGTVATTGDTIAGHAGRFAENITTSVLGGTKEQREARKAQEVQSSAQAASVVVPTGIAASGLAAQNMTASNGQNITVGDLPGGSVPGQESKPIQLDAAPAVQPQVMEVHYSPEKIRVQGSDARDYNPEKDQASEAIIEIVAEPVPANYQRAPQPAPGKGPTDWQDQMKKQGKTRTGPSQSAKESNAIVTQEEKALFKDAINKAQELAGSTELTYAL